MDDPRVAQLITLFERALDLPHAQRAEFIDQVVGDDAALREELSSLLEAHESATDYFEDLAEHLVSPAYTALVGTGNPESESALLPQLQAALGNTYRILEELDSGMSRVFLAEEIKLDRKVVIKVLPTAMPAATSAERFRREIQLAARLQHPHIVPLLTSDAVDSLLYYTMPYVAGESLRARLSREGPLPIREAQRIWRDMLDALAHAHASGVIHRDIKPGNVLLSARNAFVSDFGIARAIQAAAGDARETAPGFSIGTPAYMAPEQVLGDRDADHRVDIYAAGLVMYEMLEGRLPFSGDSARELTLARLTEEPAPVSRADCPPQLAALVMRCLAMAPAARPHAVEAVLAELEAIPMTSAPVGAGPRRRPRAVALGAVALAVAAAWFVVTQSRNDRRAVAAAMTSAPSIAVLPLRNLSADPGDAALADGMTEELIAMLSRVGELRVIASTSVYAFEGRRMDVRQIAESLRVSHVLEGGLQKAGRRLRLRLRLVDARDGANLWSEVYDREMGDIFAVQDDIAWVVSRELDVRLARGGRARPGARRYTPRIEAYEWYLRGTDPTLPRNAGGFRQAREYLNRAIATDSSFASAYAALAGLYIRGTQSSPGERGDSLARAERAARKAIALDDSLAEGHAALGWARIAYRDWAGAEAELKRALALDPRAPWPHEGMARVYLWTGRPIEQLQAARIGVEVDPFSVTAVRELALALAMNGRCDEAIDSLRPLKALTPPAGLAGVITGQCYAAQRRWREAIAEFRWAIEANAGMALGFLGYALARAGQQDSARTILSDLLTGRKQSNGAFGIASVYAGLGEYDETFSWLHKAVDEHMVRPYLMGPMFEELRRDPRFAGVKRHMGL